MYESLSICTIEKWSEKIFGEASEAHKQNMRFDIGWIISLQISHNLLLKYCKINLVLILCIDWSLRLDGFEYITSERIQLEFE